MADSRLPLSWILGATAVALAAASLVVIFGSGGGDEAGGESSGSTLPLIDADDIAESAHDVALADIGDDGVRSLDTFMDGRPIVVNFFAEWCVPCIEEMPAFERVHQSLGDEVQIIGLASPPGEDDAAELVERTGVTYPTFADPDGAAFEYFQATGMPTTAFIATDGRVLEVHSGELSEDELRAKIAEHYGIESVTAGAEAQGGS